LNLFLLALVFGAVAVLFWQVSSFLKPADDVVIPNLVGKTLADARELGRQEKFDLAIVDSSQYRDKEPEGVIYQMQPTPGRHIREGKSVSIWVSKGPPMVTVPDVRTNSREKAVQILVENNLKVGLVTKDFDPTIDAGLVSQQAPAPGESHPRGTKVNLVLSKGQDNGTDTGTSTPEPADTPSPSPTPDSSDSGNTNRKRTFDIKFPVPKDGQPHHIRVDVTDRNGTRTAYDDTRQSGEMVRCPIDAVGGEIHIRVFDNDKLISDRLVK